MYLLCIIKFIVFTPRYIYIPKIKPQSLKKKPQSSNQIFIRVARILSVLQVQNLGNQLPILA